MTIIQVILLFVNLKAQQLPPGFFRNSPTQNINPNILRVIGNSLLPQNSGQFLPNQVNSDWLDWELWLNRLEALLRLEFLRTGQTWLSLFSNSTDKTSSWTTWGSLGYNHQASGTISGFLHRILLLFWEGSTSSRRLLWTTSQLGGDSWRPISTWSKGLILLS